MHWAVLVSSLSFLTLSKHGVHGGHWSCRTQWSLLQLVVELQKQPVICSPCFSTTNRKLWFNGTPCWSAKSSSPLDFSQQDLLIGSARVKLWVTQVSLNILVVSLCTNDHFQITSSSSFAFLWSNAITYTNPNCYTRPFSADQKCDLWDWSFLIWKLQ